jgi:hypothetical protein
MATVSGHSFNIRPMGKLFKSSPLKPVSQFKANNLKNELRSISVDAQLLTEAI